MIDGWIALGLLMLSVSCALYAVASFIRRIVQTEDKIEALENEVFRRRMR